MAHIPAQNASSGCALAKADQARPLLARYTLIKHSRPIKESAALQWVERQLDELAGTNGFRVNGLQQAATRGTDDASPCGIPSLYWQLVRRETRLRSKLRPEVFAKRTCGRVVHKDFA
jgi:hypothetical protein